MKKDSTKGINIPNIRNITISGRIGTGKSTLAKHLADKLGWTFLDGGAIFRRYAKQEGFHIVENQKIPDEFDKEIDTMVMDILKKDKHYIIQSHLAGFFAKDLKDVYKILVVCQNERGEDIPEIRVDRITNRDVISVDSAKQEVIKREERHLSKFRRLYANRDENWVYWKKEYYDLVVNTYNLGQKDALEFVLKSLNIPL